MAGGRAYERAGVDVARDGAAGEDLRLHLVLAADRAELRDPNLVEAGGEFGPNTGRRRRVGWLDTVMTRYASKVNSLTELAITKLDILDELETLKVCVAYEDETGRRYDWMPYQQSVIQNIKPVYKDFPGWKCDTSCIVDRDDLPTEANSYLAFVEEQSGVPVNFVGVGPGRHQFFRFHIYSLLFLFDLLYLLLQNFLLNLLH